MINKRNYDKFTVFVSFLPFVLWLLMIFNNNVWIDQHLLFGIGVAVFFVMCLLSANKQMITLYGSIPTIGIMVYYLAREGEFNDTFRPLYKYFIIGFLIYYLVVNIIAKKEAFSKKNT